MTSRRSILPVLPWIWIGLAVVIKLIIIFSSVRTSAAAEETGALNVAVLVSGAERGFITKGIYETHLRHVQSVLLREGHTVHTFLCTDLRPVDAQNTSLLQLLRVRAVHDADQSTIRSSPWHLRWPGENRIADCYDHANAAAADDFSYDFFVRTRPDNTWFADMPPLSSVRPGAVALRARVLSRYQPPSNKPPLDDDYFSYGWASGRCEDRDAVALCGVSDRAREREAQPCLLADDQFAIVARRQAERYFHHKSDDGDASSAAPPSTTDEAIPRWRVCCDGIDPFKSWAEYALTTALVDAPTTATSSANIQLIPARVRLDPDHGGFRGGACYWPPCDPPEPKSCAAERAHSLVAPYIGEAFKETLGWWEMEAVDKSYADAQCTLGEVYERGLGVQQSYARAFELYEKASKQKFAQGQFLLANAYYLGQGVDVDYKKASEGFEKAAKQGHAKAQNSLAVMYKNGQGAGKDDSKALEWHKRAVEQVAHTPRAIMHHHHTVQRNGTTAALKEDTLCPPSWEQLTTKELFNIRDKYRVLWGSRAE